MKNFMVFCALLLSGFLSEVSAHCSFPDNFNGMYIGGTTGILSHTAYRNDANGFLTDNASWTLNDSNFLGGARVGYDQQWSNRLVGIVADWNVSGAHKDLNEGPAVNPENRIKADLEWVYTIRARAGVIVSDALVYVTGGVAAGRFFTEWNDSSDQFHSHKTRWGWVGGVGTEFNVCRDWSVGGEILTMHFADATRDFRSNAGQKYSFTHGDTVVAGCITFNYRFDRFCPCW